MLRLTNGVHYSGAGVLRQTAALGGQDLMGIVTNRNWAEAIERLGIIQEECKVLEEMGEQMRDRWMGPLLYWVAIKTEYVKYLEAFGDMPDRIWVKVAGNRSQKLCVYRTEEEAVGLSYGDQQGSLYPVARVRGVFDRHWEWLGVDEKEAMLLCAVAAMYPSGFLEDWAGRIERDAELLEGLVLDRVVRDLAEETVGDGRRVSVTWGWSLTSWVDGVDMNTTRRLRSVAEKVEKLAVGLPSDLFDAVRDAVCSSNVLLVPQVEGMGLGGLVTCNGDHHNKCAPELPGLSGQSAINVAECVLRSWHCWANLDMTERKLAWKVDLRGLDRYRESVAGMAGRVAHVEDADEALVLTQSVGCLDVSAIHPDDCGVWTPRVLEPRAGTKVAVMEQVSGGEKEWVLVTGQNGGMPVMVKMGAGAVKDVGGLGLVCSRKVRGELGELEEYALPFDLNGSLLRIR